MAQDTIECGVEPCDYQSDNPNALWSHIKMSARHEDENGPHSVLMNRKQNKEDESGSGDMVQDMKESAQEEKESGIQKVETPDKPADEPDYMKILEVETEGLSEEEKQMLLQAREEGFTEIEADDSKPIQERDVR